MKRIECEFCPMNGMLYIEPPLRRRNLASRGASVAEVYYALLILTILLLILVISEAMAWGMVQANAPHSPILKDGAFYTPEQFCAKLEVVS